RSSDLRPQQGAIRGAQEPEIRDAERIARSGRVDAVQVVDAKREQGSAASGCAVRLPPEIGAASFVELRHDAAAEPTIENEAMAGRIDLPGAVEQNLVAADQAIVAASQHRGIGERKAFVGAGPAA